MAGKGPGKDTTGEALGPLSRAPGLGTIPGHHPRAPYQADCAGSLLYPSPGPRALTPHASPSRAWAPSTAARREQVPSTACSRNKRHVRTHVSLPACTFPTMEWTAWPWTLQRAGVWLVWPTPISFSILCSLLTNKLRPAAGCTTPWQRSASLRLSCSWGCGVTCSGQ